MKESFHEDFKRCHEFRIVGGVLSYYNYKLDAKSYN